MPEVPNSAPPEQPKLLTVKETAEYLRVPLTTVYYLAQRGQLPAIQIGGRGRIKRSGTDKQIKVVTIAAETGLHDTINNSSFNDDGLGIFTRPGHEGDKNTDIFVTCSTDTSNSGIGVKEDFVAHVIHILETGTSIPKTKGHTVTTIENLPKTVQEVARLIKQNG